MVSIAIICDMQLIAKGQAHLELSVHNTAEVPASLIEDKKIEKLQRGPVGVCLSQESLGGEGHDTVLEEIVDALCQHISDDSPMMILGVILVWLADLDDSVQLTAVLCLLSDDIGDKSVVIFQALLEEEKSAS
ncbi:hypothetical protein Tco_1182966 [Tanacetum coccineum]